MKKKISLYMMALLSMVFVGCDKDYQTEVAPQHNDAPKSILQTSDINVSAMDKSFINLADYKTSEGDEPISFGVVKVKEGAMPANTELKATVEVSIDENFPEDKTIEMDAYDFDETGNIWVSPTMLQDLYFNNITHNPNAKKVYTRVSVFTQTAGEAKTRIGNAADEYFAQHSFDLKPIDTGVRLSKKYYIIGTPQGWKNTKPECTSLAFEHSDKDVYDDPVFTILIDAPTNGDGDREDCWFSILADDDVDAFAGGDWNVLLGNTEKNGSEKLSGTLMSRNDFGGDNNMKMPATDGATKYQITLDVLEGTFDIKPMTPGAKFDTDPILFLTGDHYGWGGTWVPMAPVHSHGTYSWIVIYLHEGEQFKFAPQAGWGDDFGMNVESVVDNAGMNPSGDNNIIVGNAGWYLIKVDNTPGARKVEFNKPEVYLMGNTSPAGWNTAAEGLFTVPTTEDGTFESPAFIADDEVRMCIKLADCDWWQTEFIITQNGQIDYRGAGDDQSRVNVKTGQKCYINFGTGSGYYK